MGAEPWSYFVPYQKDIPGALEALKDREFRAGRYRRPDEHAPPPATIAEAVEQAQASGTRSVLDMIGLADTPHEPQSGLPHFCEVAPLRREDLVALFGTTRPTRELIRARRDYLDLLERGEGIYIVVYAGDEPSELFFAGYSFD